MRIGLIAIAAASCTPLPEDPGPAPLPPGTLQPLDTGSPNVQPPYEMSGFSFVEDHLAGLPQPGRFVPLEQDLAFLVEQGIDILVSLTVTPTDPVAVHLAGMMPVHLPIEDFHPPTPEQQDLFVESMFEAIDRDLKVAVHCTAGLGRTGTMLATWFVAIGMDPEQAIAHVRSLRPGSIETDEQEAAIYAFAERWSALEPAQP